MKLFASIAPAMMPSREMIDRTRRGLILTQARRWLGTRYDYSHTDPRWSDRHATPDVFDCSTFVCRVAMDALQHGPGFLAHSARWLLDNLVETENVEPGDVVGYGRPAILDDGAIGHQIVWHVMIYVGNGQVIGACDIARGVTIRAWEYEHDLAKRRWHLIAPPPFRTLVLRGD